MIDISSNIEKLTKNLNTFQRKVIPQAISSSLNKTGRTLFKEIKRDIAKDTGLKQKEIAERMSLQKSNRNNLNVSIRMRGRWFNLIRFKARQLKRGVKTKAWGEWTLNKGAFIANKGRTVFARISKARLPIKALVGPNPVIELDKRIEKLEFNLGIKSRFGEVFPRELAYRLSKVN